MTSQDVNAIKEFRRFTTTYIYPYTSYILIDDMRREFNTNGIMFVPLPQQTIQFQIANNIVTNKSENMKNIHNDIKQIFCNYFNNQEIISIIRNKMYTCIKDEDIKKTLLYALNAIQHCDPQYLGLLFNITILNDTIYIYL